MSIPKVPGDLLAKIKNRECAVFVGSGLSTLAGLPSWKALLLQLLEKYYEGHVDQKSKQTLLDMAESGRLVDLAEFIRASLRPKTFRDTLITMLDPHDAKPSETHVTLASIPFSAVITTNYDHLLEDTYSIVHDVRYARSYPYTNISALANLVAEKKFFILKAHGTVEDPDNIIFSRTDHQQVMFSSPAYRTFFSSLFASRTFLFIGYSLSDPDLTIVLENLATIFKGFCPVHYVLLPDTGEIERKLFEQRFNIEVIPYTPSSEQHPEVHGFLKAIVGDLEAEKAKQEAQERQALVENRLASIGELASGIAHELNNPLTSIIGFSAILLDKNIPEDLKEYVKIIDQEARRTAMVVKNLLTFARKREPDRQPVDINKVILGLLELRAYEHRVNNIRVKTHFTPNLQEVTADRFQLEQVFLNIIINAEYFMTEAHGKGTLTVTTEQIGDIIKASFIDNGSGIAKENLEHLFDPFFTTKEAGKGTGLGLSICHGIITNHNGRIYAMNNSGRGATFIVELPAVAEAKRPEPAEIISKAKRISPAKILVVDDEPRILQLIEHSLSEKGYEVETLVDSNDVLERLKVNTYDIILLDIKLPSIDGMELYHRIAKIDKSLARKIIFITAATRHSDVRDFLFKTKAPYLVKPFSIEELADYIDDVLGQIT